MNTYVIDASVAVKWFVPEKDSIRAVELLSRTNSNMIVPDLLFLECASALHKKNLLGEISLEEGRNIFEMIQNLPLSVYRSMDLVGSAFKIASHIQESVYDCLYLAAALTLKCPLITADRNFYRAVSRTEFNGAVVLL